MRFKTELFLGAGAGLQSLEVGAGAGELPLQCIEARLEFVRPESRDQIALRDSLSLADGKVDEKAGDLEGELDLCGRFDAAGKGAAAGVRATGDDERADGADKFGGWFRRPRAGGEEKGHGGGAGDEEMLEGAGHRDEIISRIAKRTANISILM